MSLTVRGKNRLVLTAALRIATPFRVGASEWSPLSDLPVLRDQAGALLIEGTSMAGVLRGFLLRETRLLTIGGMMGEQAVLKLFGTAPTGGTDEGGCISRIRIPSIRLGSGIGTAVRDHVGIDRYHGAARGQVRFDAEVVPAGQKFELHVTLDDPTLEDRVLIGLLERGIKDGRIAIGSKTGTGFGRLEILRWEPREANFAQPTTLKSFLERDQAVWIPDGEPTSLQSVPLPVTFVAAPNPSPFVYEVPNRLFVTYRVAVRDFLLIKDGVPNRFALKDLKIPERAGEEGKTIDHAPYLEPGDGSETVQVVAGRVTPAEARQLDLGEVVLPGSSIRGALRSRAEKILRTLALGTGWTITPDTEKQKMAACDVLEREADSPYGSCSSRMDQWVKSGTLNDNDYYRAVYADACLTCRLFGYSHLKGRLVVEDLRPVPDIPLVMKLLDHVAIDRFTGGAANQKKFNALAVAAGVFEGRLRLEGFEPYHLGLLSLLFKDLWCEDLPLGSGGTRGYGSVKGWPISVALECVPESWDPVYEAFGRIAKSKALPEVSWNAESGAPWARVDWRLRDPLAIDWNSCLPPTDEGMFLLPYLEECVAEVKRATDAFSVLVGQEGERKG